MATPYQLPSSFSGGMAGAVESLKKGTLPQSITSPVVKPAQVKQTTKLPQKKTGYVPLTREQFMKAQESGITPDQIIEFEKRRKSEMEAPQAPKFDRSNPQQFVKDYEQSVREGNPRALATGVFSGITKGLGNIAQFVEKTPSFGEVAFGKKDTGLPSIADPIQKRTNMVADTTTQKLGVNPESNFYKGGEFAGQVALTNALVPGVGPAGVGVKLPARIIAGGAEGLAQMGAFDAVNKGKTSKESLATGLTLGSVMPIAGATLTKAKDMITKSLPKGLISSGLATPTKLLNASERLSKLADDGILDVDSAPQWMLDKGLKGNKKQITEQLRDVVKESAQKKATLLSNPAPVKDLQKVKDLQLALGDILKNYAKVDRKGVVLPKPGNEDIVEQILAFVNSKTPNAKQFDDARTILGNAGIFKKTGEMVDEGSKRGLQKIWIDASKYLDETYPGFRSLNKDIEVAMALGQAIGLKEAQDLARKYGNLVNLGAGAGGAYAGYQAGGLKGAGIGLVTGLAGKYVINNPAVTTNLAQGLSKSGPGLDTLFKIGAKGKKLIIPAVSSLSGTE